MISGVVGIAGPYAFNPLLYSSTRPIFEAADAAETQVVTFAGKGAPPMLLLHGLDDGTVKPVNSRRLAKRLHRAGSEVELIEYEGLGHYLIVAALAAPFQGEGGIMDAAAAFVRGETPPLPARPGATPPSPRKPGRPHAPRSVGGGPRRRGLSGRLHRRRLDVAVQVEAAGDEPAGDRPGAARQPAGEHVARPVDAEVEPAQSHRHGESTSASTSR